MERFFLEPRRFLSAPVDDDLVLLERESGRYLALNRTGAALLARLREGPASVDELVTTLTARFEIGAEIAADDVRHFVLALQERQLIRAESPAP